MLLRRFKLTFTTTRTTTATTAGAPGSAQVMALFVIVVTADVIYFICCLFKDFLPHSFLYDINSYHI
jgi:hypothetical protein